MREENMLVRVRALVIRSALFLLVLGSLLEPRTALGQEPIRTGMIGGLTGYLVYIDTAYRDGALLAIEQLNAGGGVLGRKLTLVVEDNKSQPSPSVVALKKLTEQDRIMLLLGGCSSAGTAAMAPILVREKVPTVACSILPAADDQQGRQWVFTTVPNPRFDIGDRLAYLAGMGLTRVGLIHDTTPYATLQRDIAATIAKDVKITIVGVEQYRPDDTDITPQITKLRAAGPQAIMQLGGGPSTGIIAKTMDELRMNMPLAADQSMRPQEAFQIAGDAVNKLIFPATPPTVYDDIADSDPRKLLISRFITDWRKKYGGQRDPAWGARGYDAMMLLAEAIKRAGVFEGEKIRAAMETLRNLPGVAAIYTYEAGNHDGVRNSPFVMARVEKERARIIKK
jgi:branched-chain amino acid transport system substrate-binding protein